VTQGPGDSRAEHIRSYYDSRAEDEWDRLDRHRTEFEITLRTLRKHLPSSGRVLDVGSGPGRYAIELAKTGYELTLLDLSEKCLELAQKKAGEAGVAISAIRGDGLDLLRLFGDGDFDAVLMLGPLYHLLEREKRQHALRGALSVVKPDGLLFAAYLTRYASLRHDARFQPERLCENRPYAERLLETGVHDQVRDFTDSYFAYPSGVSDEIESSGFEVLELIGCEGVLAGHEQRVNELEGEAWDCWVDFNERIGRDSEMLAASDHLLCVARKS
jgi:2-polyprenyl-3-methyl-5-hydroxy-6-metoxy-1,4-benzoquinol methylase